jgi:hypothetical protein
MASAPNPAEIDPLRLVYLLVLDGQGPPDLLVHLDPSRIIEAGNRFRDSHLQKSTLGAIGFQQALFLKYPHVQPHPLWRAWMENTQSAAIERLRAELFGNTPP